MKVEIVSTADVEPVGIDELKQFLKVTGSAHDAVLNALNESARKYLEKSTDLSFMTKSLKVTVDRELEEWELPYGPVNEITNSEEPNDDDEYVYEYDAGYEDLPYDLKIAIKITVKYWYDMDDVSDSLPMAARKIVELNQRNPML
jgi:hypothetical protein